VLSRVNKLELLTRLVCGRERFALDSGPLLPLNLTAAWTDHLVLAAPRCWLTWSVEFVAQTMFPPLCLYLRGHRPTQKKEDCAAVPHTPPFLLHPLYGSGV
jgi:hypothetical protein